MSNRNYGSFTTDIEFGVVTVYSKDDELTVSGFSDRCPPMMKTEDIPILIAMLQKAYKGMMYE